MEQGNPQLLFALLAEKGEELQQQMNESKVNAEDIIKTIESLKADLADYQSKHKQYEKKEAALQEQNENLKMNILVKLDNALENIFKQDQLEGTLEELVTLIKHTTMTTKEIQKRYAKQQRDMQMLRQELEIEREKNRKLQVENHMIKKKASELINVTQKVADAAVSE